MEWLRIQGQPKQLLWGLEVWTEMSGWTRMEGSCVCLQNPKPGRETCLFPCVLLFGLLVAGGRQSCYREKSVPVRSSAAPASPKPWEKKTHTHTAPSHQTLRARCSGLGPPRGLPRRTMGPCSALEVDHDDQPTCEKLCGSVDQSSSFVPVGASGICPHWAKPQRSPMIQLRSWPPI